MHLRSLPTRVPQPGRAELDAERAERQRQALIAETDARRALITRRLGSLLDPRSPGSRGKAENTETLAAEAAAMETRAAEAAQAEVLAAEAAAMETRAAEAAQAEAVAAEASEMETRAAEAAQAEVLAAEASEMETRAAEAAQAEAVAAEMAAEAEAPATVRSCSAEGEVSDAEQTADGSCLLVFRPFESVQLSIR